MMAIDGRPQDPGLSLARALINASNLPLLLFDGGLKVVASSRSFGRAFGLTPEQVDGRELAQIGAGEWDIPQLRGLLTGALGDQRDAGPYEADLARAGVARRRLMFNVQKVEYDDLANPRVMLAIEDVTDVRSADRQIMSLILEKDELLLERATLLQEMQHRIANSLQIIASVLLLKARAVKSEETRASLRDAHDRVMSVAAVQQHLQSHLGEVEVGAYLTKLCESLGSSMIRESRPLVLQVRADSAIVSSHDAVSLGLIVTELVINALKHAFPGGRSGQVLVSYEVSPEGWTLSVTDDGIGRPTDIPAARVGLGSSVVEALARQLNATVVISDAKPGARIAIVANAGNLPPKPHI
jgi:two-component sensor histidine kinase